MGEGDEPEDESGNSAVRAQQSLCGALRLEGRLVSVEPELVLTWPGSLATHPDPHQAFNRRTTAGVFDRGGGLGELRDVLTARGRSKPVIVGEVMTGPSDAS